MAATPLKSVRGMALASSVLVAITAALGVIELLARRAARDDARRFEAGELNDIEFVEAIAGYALMSVVIVVATIGAAVFSIMWLYRIAWNLRALHRGSNWGPGWAIGGWFTPPLIYVLPTLMLREFWRASDPEVPVGGDWRSRKSSPLPFLWFVFYSVSPIVALTGETISNGSSVFGGTEQQIADQILGDATWSIVGACVSVVAAAIWIVIVRGLTHRHRLLTGEADRHR